MRLDYLTIFPDYLAPLHQSLTGKAVERGLVELHVHDLRTWTTDRHRTVDDAPFGGGAGMVMTPTPFGAAFDALAVDGATVVVPTPSGTPFTQATARTLSARERLVFLCGRYEGIDQRVLDHAATRAELVEVSLGDYVLNGGEVAALAVTEAVVRLLPGFMGNAESLVEESHEGGLLEYPVYTRPASWRGLDVPPVLLSGDHAAIAAWRLEQSRRRTAQRRPDLLHPSAAATGWEIAPARPGDAGELLTLQRACSPPAPAAPEAAGPPPLVPEEPPQVGESLEDVTAALGTWSTWVARSDGRLVGAVRARVREAAAGPVWHVERLLVVPDLSGRGPERALLDHVEAVRPPEVQTCELHVLAPSAADLRAYAAAGYRRSAAPASPPGALVLTKRWR